MSQQNEKGNGTVLDRRMHRPRATAGIVAEDTKIFLRVVGGDDTGKVFDLSRGGSFIIGRVKADIVLGDAKVSTRHAELRIFGPGHYYLYDLASTNAGLLT